MMNKIFLTTYLDNLVKYNIKDKDLDLLSSNYSIPYMNYDNTYSGISKEKLYKYFDKGDDDVLLVGIKMNREDRSGK